MVKEFMTIYANSHSPRAMHRLFALLIEIKDHEYLAMAESNQKLEPTNLQTIHIGTINL